MNKVDFISYPVSTIKGILTVPGDKSISHRAIVFAALAKGITTIIGFLQSEDCLATLKAFKAMGVFIEEPCAQKIVVHGVGQYGLKQPPYSINCGNSATSMRLLAGLLSAQPFDSQLTGDESLLKRPMLRISEPLIQMGAAIDTQHGKPPLTIKGGKQLTGIDYLMPQASAQVKSCLLLAGLYATGKTRITQTQPTRDHTELMLKTYGYTIHYSAQTIEISSKKKTKEEYRNTVIHVPGDLSSAAFFIVAATIIPNSSIIIKKVGINPTRTGVITILKKMGANIVILNQGYFGEELVADLQVSYSPLMGIAIPASLVSLAIDEFPIIFIAAACAQGQTTLKGATELKVKESDRIEAMVAGLVALGIKAQGYEDGVTIEGGLMQGGIVDSQGDHRIAMAFSIAGAIACNAVTIKNCANVATSFPNFIAHANSMHCQIEEVLDNG